MADYNSSLPVRSELNNGTSDLQIVIADGTVNTQLWNINANGIGQVNLNDGTNALVIGPAGQITTIVTDGTDTIAIDASGNLSTFITDGTDTLAVNPDGSINANIVSATAGDQIHVFDTTASVAVAATDTTVDYTVTALKTLLLRYVHAGTSGKAKVEVLTGPTGLETTKAVFFISTASGFGYADFPNEIEVVAGDKVLVKITNRDNQSQDVYAYINGQEV